MTNWQEKEITHFPGTDAKARFVARELETLMGYRFRTEPSGETAITIWHLFCDYPAQDAVWRSMVRGYTIGLSQAWDSLKGGAA